MHPPTDFILWIVVFLIAQFPLRLHNESEVMGAGQQLLVNLFELTPLGVELLEMCASGRQWVDVPDGHYFHRELVDIAVKDRVQQIARFIDLVLRYRLNKLDVLQEFILVAITQRDLLHRMTSTIAPRRLRAKVGVCDTIIRVCTNKLNSLLCRFDVYCRHQTICGCGHWSLNSISRMALSVEDSRFVDWVYQKYKDRIYAVVYNRGGRYELNLFYKAYQYLYKESFVKMSKHLFLRVLMRISMLELRQVPCGITLSIKSDEAWRYAMKDRNQFDSMRIARQRQLVQ